MAYRQIISSEVDLHWAKSTEKNETRCNDVDGRIIKISFKWVLRSWAFDSLAMVHDNLSSKDKDLQWNARFSSSYKDECRYNLGVKLAKLNRQPIDKDYSFDSYSIYFVDIHGKIYDPIPLRSFTILSSFFVNGPMPDHLQLRIKDPSIHITDFNLILELDIRKNNSLAHLSCVAEPSLAIKKSNVEICEPKKQFEGNKVIECSKNDLNDFESLFKEQIFSDVSVMVAGKEIRAHKCILAARSPIFAEMLTSKEDPKKANKKDILKIKGISYEIMREILVYMYTGRIRDLGKTKSEEILLAAKKFSINSLVAKCEEFLT